MAKRFKLRISRVIPSFQSCRSKDQSTVPQNPVRTTPSKPNHSTIKRHVSSAITTVGCGFRSKSCRQYRSDDDDFGSSEFKWRKEDKWHVIAKVHDDTPRRKLYNTSVSGESETDDTVFPPPPPTKTVTPLPPRKRRSRKKKSNIRSVRISTSSLDTELFGSERVDDDEERETLVSSSRSFTTDSSSETIRETPNLTTRKHKTKSKPKWSVSKMSTTTSPETESPARLSMFQRLISCRVEGKVRESFAVVKKSSDPYEDFKRSMMEMILEKEMYEERDLEQLLHCFLSLNSRNHHGIIVQAFSEIWGILFRTVRNDQRVSLKGV